MKIEIDVDEEVSQSFSERDLLHRLLAVAKHLRQELVELNKTKEKLMITAAQLQASSDALTAAVTATIALLPPNTAASTPDSVVTAFQSNVDAQTARLVQADTTGATPPPPPAPAKAP